MPNSSRYKLAPSTSEASLNVLPLNDGTFEIFFKENFPGLCIYCQYKFGFDVNMAKEAVHRGFIKLWENRDSIDPALAVKAYLYTIITHICIDILKHEKVMQKHAKTVLQEPANTYHKNHFDCAEYNELRKDIDKAVYSLPEQMRTIFQMSRYDGLKYAEIAAKLNISIKTVETQMSRALIKLRQKLSHYLSILVILVMV